MFIGIYFRKEKQRTKSVLSDPQTIAKVHFSGHNSAAGTAGRRLRCLQNGGVFMFTIHFH